MLKKILIPIFLSLCFFGIFGCRKPSGASMLPGEKKEAAVDVSPFLKSDGKKWRVLIVQSGEYYSYLDTFKSILMAMQNEGWLSETPLPEKSTMKELVEYLQKNPVSGFLEFSSDLLVDFDWNDKMVGSGKWAEPFRSKNIDLVIALGTLAGQAAAGLKNWQIPVLVDSVSDPVGAGISRSNEDSGADFLTVRTDPQSYLRQIRLFYDVVKFKRLGMIYSDTVVGRGYAALSDVEAVAKEKGFEIVSQTRVLEDPPEDQMPQAQVEYLKALEELCPRVDALYLTIQAGLTEDNIASVMAVINRYKIPSFAMEGPVFVRKGVLFGVSDNELLTTGIYNLKKIAQIFRGKSPRSLQQIFEHTPHIAINLKAAENIGYDIPVDIISSSDEIYKEIQ